MPIIKSAKKKMRKDKKRTAHNLKIKNNLKKLLKTARRAASDSNLSAVFSSLDKAVKTKLIHPNKAARLKGRLTKTNPNQTVTTTKKSTKKKAPIKKATSKR